MCCERRKVLNSMRMTLSELLVWGETKLKEAGIAEARSDAWFLLEYVTGIDRAKYLCDRECFCEEEQVKQYQRLTERRMTHMPLQYLTGEQEFMGLSFLVNEYVLIPRQDTEVLVEEVLKFLKPGMKVLDMCTGSGCILISLAHYCRLGRAVGADLSWEALKVAKRNAERNKEENKNKKQNGTEKGIQNGSLSEQEEEMEWLCTDMFEKVKGQFDCIVSNPPYIATAVIETLAEEVKEHEPLGALDGMEDGLYFYRILASQAGKYLSPGGMLYLEIGYDQGEAVLELLRENGFYNVQIKKDLAGLDRVCFGAVSGKKKREKGSAGHV